MDIDVNNLTSRIREILSQSDLATVSAKKVRRQLENELNTTLEMYKTDIDNIIKQQFQQIHTETQQRQQAQQQYAQHYGQMAAANNIYANGGQLPPGLQMPPGGGVIPGGMHAGMLSSQQQHAAGSMSPDAMTAGPRKRGRPRKTDAEKKLQRKKRELDPNRPKRHTGLSKPMKLSSDLSDFLEQKYCARTDVVKNLWKYIKANDLQDPSDKRYIMCDEKLKHLFHTDRLYMYTMNKLLNDHLIKPTPEENAEAMALLDLPPTHPAAADSAGVAGAAGEATQSTSAGGDVNGGSNSPTPTNDNTPAPVSAPTTANDSETKQDTAGPLALPPQPTSINGSVDTQTASTSAGGDQGGVQ